MQLIIGALFIAMPAAVCSFTSMLRKRFTTIAFSWLEQKFPIRRQKRLRPGWFTDVCHWVFNQTIVNVGVVIGAIPVYILLGWAINPSFQTQVARQPGYLQLLEAIFFAEVKSTSLFNWANVLCNLAKI